MKTKLDSLSSVNFKNEKLFQVELKEISAGAFFPKKGVDSYGGVLGTQSGATNQPWRTGWFSDTKVYGDSYWSCSDNCR
jgi:hypothetical protein